jgi:hypothetical protein
MITSTNPFNDPKVKEQLLKDEGVVEIDPDEIDMDIKEMLSSAPTLPKSAKNIILDASAISKTEKEQKSAEFNLALNSIISRYNEEYGTDINIDFSNMSNTLVAVSNPDTRRTLELYVSEVFKSVKPILLLHLLNRLVLCLDYVLKPERMLDNQTLSPADMFIIVEKLQSYIMNLTDIIDQCSIKDSDMLLDKMAEEKNDTNLNSPESKQAVDDFMRLFKASNGIED